MSIPVPPYSLRQLGVRRTPSMPRLHTADSPFPSRPSSPSVDRVPTPTSQQPMPSPKKTLLHILLPEDNGINQKITKRALEKAAKNKGVEVNIDIVDGFKPARNKILTRAQLDGEVYNAILTDNQMKQPAGTGQSTEENAGFRLAAWTKQHPKIAPPEITMYTSDTHAKGEMKLRSIQMPFMAIFTKTKVQEAAERTIANALSKKTETSNKVNINDLYNLQIGSDTALSKRSSPFQSTIGRSNSATRPPTERKGSEFSNFSYQSPPD
jgi:CheY-like chemotaxis protein